VSAIVGTPPAFAIARFKKVCQQTVRLTSHGIHFLEYASSLEFRETFQFIPRKSIQKLQHNTSIDRNCGPKKGTDQ
jgi:hypothetical protein